MGSGLYNVPVAVLLSLAPRSAAFALRLHPLFWPIIPDDMGIPLLEHLALSGRGYVASPSYRKC
jgi:hypothetical protein